MSKITFQTNAHNLATQKRFLADATGDAFRKVMQVRAQKMKAAAILLSSGTLSQADLRRLGRPYAIRFPAGSAGQPDFVISVKSGRFRGSWRTRVQKTAKGWTLTLWNDSPESRFMVGTHKMRVRPILEELDRQFSGQFPDEVRKVVRKAIRRNEAAAPSGSLLGGIAYSVFVGVASVATGLEDGFSD